jgi:translation initiation factor IF-2
MGHVDHGKTSILDAIRKTRVVDGEAGGITQHIGAYQTESGGGTLTFIDTPGHAAFTQMRARGASITDIVVLVVAATEGVMPQTVEAIRHAQAAGCPIVVAVNKIDLPGADSRQVRQRLMEHQLVSEEFGGETIFVDVSAKTGQGLDRLLEMLNLQAEVLELRADPTLRAGGVVLEASLDKGRGPVATVLVQEGTLKPGDIMVCDTEWGRVRTMENDKGERVRSAGPSVPVQVVGLSGVPSAGATFNVVESERVAKRIIDHREDQERGQPAATAPKLTLEEFFAQTGGEQQRELPVILKADVQGTCEAVKDSLEKMSTDAVNLRVISTGVGGITENDITFAKASNAIVVGFHSRPDPAARKAAEEHGIEIRTYTIIYELLDDVRAAMAGLLPPTVTEVLLGRAEVRQPFSIPKVGTIAGSKVTEGSIKRNASCRLIRDGIQVYEGRIGSLRRFKDDVGEVKTGFECGIGIEGYNDLKEGDVIEVFEFKEEAATL